MSTMTPQEALDRIAPLVELDEPEAIGALRDTLDPKAPRTLLSERTRAGLAAAKARGVALGGYRGHEISADARRKGAAARKAQADEHARVVYDQVADVFAAENWTLRGVAVELNDRVVPTPSGTGRWSATTVMRLVRRLEALGEMEERDGWLD